MHIIIIISIKLLFLNIKNTSNVFEYYTGNVICGLGTCNINYALTAYIDSYCPYDLIYVFTMLKSPGFCCIYHQFLMIQTSVRSTSEYKALTNNNITR